MLKFLFETFLLGLKNLRLHKLRSLLTALGIIFGVAAVIIMVAIGEGTKEAALEQIRQLGASNVLIRSTPPPQSSDNSARAERVLRYGLTRDDQRRLETVPGVALMVPLRDTEQKVVKDDRKVSANAIGTTPDVFDVVHLHVLPPGRQFDWDQYDSGAAVCVLGAKAAADLFPFKDPLGQTIQVGSSNSSILLLTVVGVLEPTGLRAGSEGAAMMSRDLDQDIYFPLSLAHDVFRDVVVRLNPGSIERKEIQLTEIWLQASDGTDVERLSNVAEKVVGDFHPRQDFEVKAPIQILRNAERLNRMFNFIMVGIASFSLIVGGIGIMNIMLATVTERTKEIGIRRALGAKRKHITLQFLIETTVISLSGGLIGICIGVGLAKALPVVVQKISGGNYPTSVASWSVVGSFVVSGMIGVGFGLYPAVMAARMNPIEALRHE